MSRKGVEEGRPWGGIDGGVTVTKDVSEGRVVCSIKAASRERPPRVLDSEHNL